MPPLRQVLAELGFKVDTKPLEQAKTGLGRVAGAWKMFAGVVAAGVVVQRIGSFLQSMAATGDATAKLGESLGLSVRQVAEWQDALGRAGGQVEQFGDSYKTLAKYVNDARKGGEDQLKGLRQLGVRLRDNQGRLRETSELYEDAVLGLGRITNTARRAAIAEAAFGSQGLALIRVGLAGRDALEAQRAAFERLYGKGGFERYIERSQEQAAASAQLSAAITALKRRIAEALLPSLTWLTTMASRVVEWFTRLTRGTKILETSLLLLKVALGVLGAILLTAFAPALIFLAKIAAIIGVVILVVEDLWQMFTGGKSAIAGALDALFGVGTAKAVVEGVTSAVSTLWDWLKAIGSVLVDSRTHLRLFGEALGEAIYDLPETLSAVMSSISDAFSSLWDGLRDGWTAVTELLTSGVERVLSLIDRVLAPLREVYEGAASLLGLGDDEGDGRSVPPQAVPQITRQVRGRFTPRDLPPRLFGGGTTLPVPARAASQVRVEQPVQINVSGAGDPGAVGEAVRRVLEDRERSTFEFARDVLLGIPS